MVKERFKAEQIVLVLREADLPALTAVRQAAGKDTTG
jgi:hypothetical protein